MAIQRNERRADRALYWPRDLQLRYAVARQTIDRWEKLGHIPPRDFFVGTRAVAWHVGTIERAERAQKRGARA